MDNASQRDSLPPMRATLCRMAWMAPAALMLLTATACVPEKGKQPDWQKPPKSFDVRTADLTFNQGRLEAFNSMDEAQRASHLVTLQGKEGAFKGQAVFRRSTELGDKMDDLQYGRFELYAVAPGPDETEEKGVWLEVNLEYHLFSAEELGVGWPSPSYIEFTGTLRDFSYQGSSKPRRLTLKVSVDDVKVLKD